jgi:nitrile hydratase accessory protein
MATEANRHIADLQGQLAIPRKNGEPIFADPWEARAFGMAVVLNEKQVYPWQQFSQGLAAEIAHAEQHGIDSSYYERWYAALEKLVITAGLITQEEIETRTAEYTSGVRDDHDEQQHHMPA